MTDFFSEYLSIVDKNTLNLLGLQCFEGV